MPPRKRPAEPKGSLLQKKRAYTKRVLEVLPAVLSGGMTIEQCHDMTYPYLIQVLKEGTPFLVKKGMINIRYCGDGDPQVPPPSPLPQLRTRTLRLPLSRPHPPSQLLQSLVDQSDALRDDALRRTYQAVSEFMMRHAEQPHMEPIAETDEENSNNTETDNSDESDDSDDSDDSDMELRVPVKPKRRPPTVRKQKRTVRPRKPRQK